MSNRPYDPNMRGALFRATEKRTETSPDYTGNIVIDGVEYSLSGWKKTSAKGQPFLSIAAKLKEQKPRNQDRQPPRQQFSDDIPF